MAKKGVRGQVTKRQLMKVDGVPEVLAEIEKRMDRVTGEAIKDSLIKAGTPIWREARSNIAALNVSDRLKQILTSQVIIARGKPKQPKILVGVSQSAGHRRVPGKYKLSPYWIEFGTRPHRAGWSDRSQIKAKRPFFRPAVDKARGEVRDTLAKELKALVQLP